MESKYLCIIPLENGTFEVKERQILGTVPPGAWYCHQEQRYLEINRELFQRWIDEENWGALRAIALTGPFKQKPTRDEKQNG
jgi:hypothetical protein